MTEIQAIARYTITAGKEEEVLLLLRELAHASRTEPGNLSFVVYRELENERDIVLLERFVSRDA